MSEPVDLAPGARGNDRHEPLSDIVTDVALSLRTIFATIPYYVYNFTSGGTQPIPILGDVLYVATNIPAQIVAWLTGVTGASISRCRRRGHRPGRDRRRQPSRIPPSWPAAVRPDRPPTCCARPETLHDQC
jgi:hypothetical protein